MRRWGSWTRGARQLERFLTVGIDEQTRRELGDLPRGHGVLGVLIHDPRPLRLRSVGDHPQSYGFPLGHPPMESFLGVPVRIGGDVFGNLYLTDKQGAEEFDEADEQTLVALADWAAIAIGNACRHGGVRGERDELVRAVRAFETSEAIGRALAGETELERVLELIVKRSRALVEARVMVLALREGDELVIRGDLGRGRPLPAGAGDPAGGVAERRRPARPAARSGSRTRRPDVQCGLAEDLRRAHRARRPAACSAARGSACWLRWTASSDGPEFSAEDERLMTAFATSAATAVATARDVAAEGLRRSLEAAERERSRWARELHDQTLQDLAGLKVLLSGARRAKEREQVDRILEQAIEHVQLGVDALRGLVTELRPAALDELGTAPALRALIDRTAATAGLAIELDLDLAYEQGRADTRHAPELESTLYRLVQEALTNVVKHAGASRVTVALIEDDGTVELSVTDDGAGFQTDAASEGFGLIGMRERVALLGGELDFDSQLRRGHHRRRTDPSPAAPTRPSAPDSIPSRTGARPDRSRRPDADRRPHAAGPPARRGRRPWPSSRSRPPRRRTRRTARGPPCP